MCKKIICFLIFPQRLLLKLQQFGGRYLKKGGMRVPLLCQCKELLVLGRALLAFHLQQQVPIAGWGHIPPFPIHVGLVFFFLFNNVFDPLQVSKREYCCLLKADLGQQSSL